MVLADNIPFQVVFYDGDGSDSITAENRFAILSRLLDKGYAVLRAAAGGNAAPAAVDAGRILVLGAFPDGAPALDDAAGETAIESLDISALDTDGVVDAVENFRDGRAMNQPGQWKPWFPVIDFDRCTNCMQCLSFCLFDVYGVDAENTIQVQNNDNCKTNCPACSRVCPEVAIMFPKYAGGPINGELVSETDLEREKMKVDISSLLGGDIYSRLRERSEVAKSRFSKERSADKALDERKKCLIKLQGEGMIPAEVLADLPSPEEIARRAEEAAQKARAALASRGGD
ncbi:MAG: ferredoxin family protein [Verrucomicrobiales bacterium]